MTARLYIPAVLPSLGMSGTVSLPQPAKQAPRVRIAAAASCFGGVGVVVGVVGLLQHSMAY